MRPFLLPDVGQRAVQAVAEPVDGQEDDGRQEGQRLAGATAKATRAPNMAKAPSPVRWSDPTRRPAAAGRIQIRQRLPTPASRLA